jgi:hypothetical protein
MSLLPDCCHHGLFMLLVPLNRDSKQTRRERGFEEAQEEANGPYSMNILRECKSKDTL